MTAAPGPSGSRAAVEPVRSGLLAQRELDVAFLVHAAVQDLVVEEHGGGSVDVDGGAVLLDDLVVLARPGRRG